MRLSHYVRKAPLALKARALRHLVGTQHPKLPSLYLNVACPSSNSRTFLRSRKRKKKRKRRIRKPQAATLESSQRRPSHLEVLSHASPWRVSRCRTWTCSPSSGATNLRLKETPPVLQSSNAHASPLSKYLQLALPREIVLPLSLKSLFPSRSLR